MAAHEFGLLAAIVVALVLGTTVGMYILPTDRGPVVGAPFEKDGVRITVASAMVGPVLLDGGTSSDEYHLQLNVLVENTSADKKLTYRGWARVIVGRINGTKVTDELGNEYRATPFLGNAVGQQDGAIPIYPGKCAYDLLTFERPLAAAKTLTLHVPLDWLGKDGEATLVVSTPEPSPKPRPLVRLVQKNTKKRS